MNGTLRTALYIDSSSKCDQVEVGDSPCGLGSTRPSVRLGVVLRRSSRARMVDRGRAPARCKAGSRPSSSQPESVMTTRRLSSQLMTVVWSTLTRAAPPAGAGRGRAGASAGDLLLWQGLAGRLGVGDAGRLRVRWQKGTQGWSCVALNHRAVRPSASWLEPSFGDPLARHLHRYEPR